MARKKRMNARYFVLVTSNGESGVYRAAAPRRAALKAASRGIQDIKLRERGTSKLHIYRGKRERAKASDDAPSWLPSEVWRPKVRKVGIKHL